MNEPRHKKPPLEIVCSRHFLEWLHQENVSLVFTTYQTCRLFFVGLKPDGGLSAFERLFDRAMGLYASPERLYMSSRYQIWRFDNMLEAGETYNGFDRLYVPRIGYTTGDLDVHDIVVDDAGRVVFVNTMYSCLAGISDKYSFSPLWQPPFISRLAPEDRCHLNGLAVKDGKPKYVTAVSRSDMFEGWREKRTSGGCLLDIDTGEIVAGGLSMPHSPRVYRDRIWLLNSGTGDFGYVNTATGAFEPVAFCRGYTRGLAFHNDYAVVGLSKPRTERTFTGLPLDDRLLGKDTEPACGLMIIDINSGDTRHWMLLEGVTTELYDVQVLPGVRRPMALGHKTDEIKTVITLPPRFRTAGSPSTVDLASTSPKKTNGPTASPDYRFRLDDRVSALDIIKISGITFPNVQKRWQAKPSAEKMILAVAATGKHDIAAALAELQDEGRHAQIISLFVSPAHRRRKLATRLMQMLEDALKARGCGTVELRYRTEWPDCPAIEKLIARLNWGPPITQRILYKTSVIKMAGALLKQYQLTDSRLTLFPWPELTAADRRHIQNRQKEESWFPDMLTPFQVEDKIEPVNSLGLRRDGRVAGWIITHRVEPDTIQYSALFIDEALRGSKAGLALIVEAYKRQAAAGIPNGIWMVDARNTGVIRLLNQFLKGGIIAATELKQSARRL